MVDQLGRLVGELQVHGDQVARYAEAANPITHWSEFDRGGHFAAMEAPDLLVRGVREFFRAVR